MASWADTPTAEPTPPRRPDLFTFAVYPDGLDPFLLDVPSLSGQGPAARRAYFSAMALLAGKGLNVDDFTVRVWADNADGPLVGPTGVQS